MLQESSTRGVVAYQTAPDTPNAYLFRYLLQDPPAGQLRTNSRPVKHEMVFTDMRSCANTFTLEGNGFELHKIEVPHEVEWEDPEDVSTAQSFEIK